MKKLFGIFLCVVTMLLCATLLPTEADAATTASSTCGENLTWTLDDQGTLRIYGVGAMSDFSYQFAPWHDQRNVIKAVVVEEGVTSIGNHAFAACPNLTDVTLPKSLKSIAGDAFLFCNNIENVYLTDLAAWCNISFNIFYSENTLPPIIEGYGNPLYYAENLYLNGELVTDLIIPEGVTQIPDYAFVGCDCLTSVTIPEGVTKVGIEAFFRCADLTEVTIPSSVTEISNGAFSDCSALSNVYITDLTAWCMINSKKIIGPPPFFEFSSIPSWNPLHYGAKLYLNREVVTKVSISDGITYIPDYAFDGYQYLTDVVIPDSVTTIGIRAFDGCTNLKTVIYHGTNEQWENIKFKSHNEPLLEATRIQHSYVKQGIVAPTCTKDGYTSYVCSVCGDTSMEDKVAATGHNYNPLTTAPTCTKIGYTTYTCATCADTYTSDEVATIAHSYDNGVVTKEPTTDENGVKSYTCVVCGDVKWEDIPVIESPSEPVNPDVQKPGEDISTDPTTTTCEKCANDAKMLSGWAWFIAMVGVTCILIAILLLLYIKRKKFNE